MTKIKPTITVAIPSYNKEKYIDRCIKSILVNKENIDEIILVDNCSTDKTFALAKSYEPAIKCYQNETNLGMAKNWNRCIDLCQTEWLLIFHADDEMLPGVMEKYFDFMEKFPTVSLIHADSYFVIEDDMENKILAQAKQKNFWQAGLDALSCKYGVCSATMVKKEVYDKLGYFLDGSLSADYEMWSRVASKYNVGYMNEPTVYYHSNSLSTGFNSLVKRSVREIKADWDLLTERMSLNFPTKESREEFLKKSFKSAPLAYWAVIKANLRAKNFKNVFDAIVLTIFTYHGFWSLVKSAGTVIIKKIKKLFN